MHKIKRLNQQLLLLYLIIQKNNQIENSIKRNQCDSDKISANQWDGFYTISNGKVNKHISDGQYIIATLVENNYTNVLYYTQNNIGSTSMLTDINGNKVQGYLFTPYGEPWITEDDETSVTNEITRKFTGQEFDKESGLYYYNARYYDPKAGIFITPDPAMSGLNHYAYAECNPIKFTDPTGLEGYGGPSGWGSPTGAGPGDNIDSYSICKYNAFNNSGNKGFDQAACDASRAQAGLGSSIDTCVDGKGKASSDAQNAIGMINLGIIAVLIEFQNKKTFNHNVAQTVANMGFLGLRYLLNPPGFQLKRPEFSFNAPNNGGNTPGMTPEGDVKPNGLFNEDYSKWNPYFKWHEGVDWGVKIGTKIIATTDQKVIYTGTDKAGYGKYIVTQDVNNPNTYYLAGHMSELKFAKGDTIKAGNLIGLSGDTGLGEAHFHTSTFIREGGFWKNGFVDFYSAVNPYNWSEAWKGYK